MKGYLSNGRGSATFFLIAIAILAGGCKHPRSKNDGNAAASPAVSRLSQTLVGKRITIRGKLHLFKCGQALELDDEEVVCLEFIHAKSVLDDPYDGMYEKPIEATGTLRFFHDPTPVNETRPTQREQDHYYFEKETTQSATYQMIESDHRPCNLCGGRCGIRTTNGQSHQIITIIVNTPRLSAW